MPLRDATDYQFATPTRRVLVRESYAATAGVGLVEAARRSIESFPGCVVALVGGHFKGGDFRDLREALASRGRAVIAIGEAAPLVREALADVVPVVDAASMKEAVEDFKATRWNKGDTTAAAA